MTENALIAKADDLLAQYGTDDEVDSLAERIKKTLPGGEKLTDFQLVAFAQYCRVTDVNPWRGEAYPFVDWRGQFHVIDGYKAIVRWAKQRAPYSDKYEPLTGEIGEGDKGFRCFILRHDAMPLMRELISAGMSSREAFEIAATSAVGVVTKQEMFSRKNGKPISPPTGWTWEERARTRALKNALNKSHGAPSPKEMAEGSWMVNGTKTIPDDWKALTSNMPTYEREAIAEGNAHHRASHERAVAAMQAGKTADDAMEELFGDYIDPEEHNGALVEGVPFLEGDFRGVPMDASAAEDLNEAQEDEAEKVAADLDYIPDWLDDDESRAGMWWGKLYHEAVQRLGYKNDHHVKATIEKVYGDTMIEATYRAAWVALVDHQRSKQDDDALTE